MNLASLRSSITKAAETLYLVRKAPSMQTSLAGSGASVAPPPPPSNTYLSQATVSGSTISVTFPRDRDANTVMTAAGYVFDREAAAFRKTIAPADRTRELAVLLRARIEINQILRARDQGRARAEDVAQTLRQELYALGISSRDHRIAILDPKDQAVRDALVNAGGKAVPAKASIYYAFEAPDTAAGLSLMISKLRGVDQIVPAVVAGPAQVLPSPVGYRLTARGMLLTIETASLPQTDAILARIQPRRMNSGTLEVRMDMQDPLVVKETLQKLNTYHQSILIPPHSRSSGIDLPQTTMDAVMSMTADQLLHDRGRAIAGPVTRMIEGHFGSLDEARSALGSGNPQLSKVAGVAKHIEDMQQLLGPARAAARDLDYSR